MKIRAHHLLCMQAFEGYGYSPDFVENLRKIVETIRCNPDMVVEIIDECDDICVCCPNKKNNKCSESHDSNFKIKERDSAVLHAFKLTSGEKILAKNILEQPIKSLTKIDLKKICKSCIWLDKCKL